MMNKKIRLIIIPTLLLSGCAFHYNDDGKNGMPHHETNLEDFYEWKSDLTVTEINEIEHLLFAAQHEEQRLELMRLKGGWNCVPAQIRMSQRYIKRFYSEYYNRLLADSQTTLIKLEQQNNKIYQMLEEVKYETACIQDYDFYLSEINDKIKDIEKGGIFFENDSDKLSKESIRKARQIAYLLKDFEIDGAMVMGHTSKAAEVDYNYDLGQARSDRVKQVLIDEGFEPYKIITRSYSEVLKTSTEEARNRRVNIRVTEEVIADFEHKTQIKTNYRIKDWDIEKY